MSPLVTAEIVAATLVLLALAALAYIFVRRRLLASGSPLMLCALRAHGAHGYRLGLMRFAGASLRHRAEHVARGRVVDGQRRAVYGGDPLAADEAAIAKEVGVMQRVQNPGTIDDGHSLIVARSGECGRSL